MKDAVPHRHFSRRAPKPLCRTLPQWAREHAPPHVVYRLYGQAGEGVAEFRRLLLPDTTARTDIALSLLTARRELRGIPGLPRPVQKEPPGPAAEPSGPPDSVRTGSPATSLPTGKLPSPTSSIGGEEQLGLF